MKIIKLSFIMLTSFLQKKQGTVKLFHLLVHLIIYLMSVMHQSDFLRSKKNNRLTMTEQGC